MLVLPLSKFSPLQVHCVRFFSIIEVNILGRIRRAIQQNGSIRGNGIASSPRLAEARSQSHLCRERSRYEFGGTVISLHRGAAPYRRRGFYVSRRSGANMISIRGQLVRRRRCYCADRAKEERTIAASIACRRDRLLAVRLEEAARSAAMQTVFEHESLRRND